MIAGYYYFGHAYTKYLHYVESAKNPKDFFVSKQIECNYFILKQK
jgi:hypothetical protein